MRENYLKEKIKLQLALAEKIEPLVTPFLEKTAKKYNGTLHGLEYKFKSTQSTLRKITSIINDENVENKDDKAYLDRKVNEIKDYLRYTIILEEENFTENVKNILAELKNNKYKLKDLKNRFKEPFYKDINSHYFNDEIFKFHFVFELQFHTQATLDAKEISHYLYEIVREFESELNGIDLSIMTNIYESLRKLYERINVPVDIDDIDDKNI